MSEKAYEWIEYKLADCVATITFNAPQFNNALGLKGLQEFLDALYRAEADDTSGRWSSPAAAGPSAPDSI